MKKLIIALFIASLFNSAAIAHNKDDIRYFNGEDWLQLSYARKAGYVEGYLAAMGEVRVQVSIAVTGCTSKMKDQEDEECWNKAKESWSYRFYDFTGVTVAQFVNGIDIIYTHPLNRTVYITDAIRIVRNIKRGDYKDENEVAKALLSMQHNEH
jgi:hypothetical protein